MLPGTRHTLLFLGVSKVWWSATKFERFHWTESDGSYLVGWHNRDFFLDPPEDWRRMYVATPTSWTDYETCRAFSVPSSSVFVYKGNAMVEVDDGGRFSRTKYAYQEVFVAGHCVIVILQELE